MIISPNSLHDHVTVEAKNQEYMENKPLFSITAHQFGGFALITHHTFNKQNQLKPGRIIEPQAAIDALIAATAHVNDDSGWVSNRVIYNTNRLLVWSCKKHCRKAWFRQADDMVSVDVTYPNLVFILNRETRTLYVFACMKNNAGADTKLYHAPVMNVYVNGSLCQGSAPLPTDLSGCSEALLVACENTLLDTAFTHVNHQATFKAPRNSKNGDVSTLRHIQKWKLIAAEARAPKASELTPTRLSLNDTLRMIGGQ